MKRITTLLAILMLSVTALFAQAPEKFTYQAVVRNASNSLVANAPVGVRVSILQGGVNGTLVYMETHTSVTNANGLITLQIGSGSVQQGSFPDINWANGSYFLKTETDPNGGANYSIISTQQMLSVPYALFAKDAGNIPTIPANVSAFANDAGYITAQDIPEVPTVPTNVSAFTNDAGYLTNYTETDPQYSAWDKNYNDLINKPTIPTVPNNVSAFNNDAGYITAQDIPAIPTVPTNVSAFTNDAGYLTNFTETDPTVPAWAKAENKPTYNYSEIINTPTIPIVPSQVSAFTNDAGYLTSITETDPQFNAWDKNYNDLTNKPTLFSGNYNDLTNKPTLFDGNYNSLTNKPNLATVAISGSYNDLINKPSIPTVVGELTNNVGYITAAQVPAQVNADWNATTGAAQILNKPTLFSGNYNDLTNKPTIPTVPTNVSAFTNDAGYVTSTEVQQAAGIPTVVSAFQNDAGYITAAQVPAQVNADWNATSGAAKILNKPALFSGNYNDLTNKPTLFDGDYNSLTNKPNLATVATTGNYNDLTNKPTIPTVPSNVSVFNNDAHYITEAQLNALLAAMNNTIDSLRDRIEELGNGTTPLIPDTTNPVTPNLTDGQPCPGMSTVMDYDGNTYNTVAIGQQCWMKENLRSTHYYDGTEIPQITYANSSYTPVRYNPGGDPSNVSTYGYLYNWYAVMDNNISSNTNPSSVQGICPMGWHVPSNMEWSQLTGYVTSCSNFQCGGNAQNIAKALASNSDWTSLGSILCAVGYNSITNNATGFSALPAGEGGSVGTNAYFWSCSQSNSNSAYAIQLDYSSSNVTIKNDADKSDLYSVRCVSDYVITGGGQNVVTGSVSSVTSTTALCGGLVILDNNYAVIARGVCWSTSPNPTVNDSHTFDGSGAGIFTSSITGLSPETIYYVRAYVVIGEGTSYGDVVSFSTPALFNCGTSTISDYDGNVYNTVQIGSQCWMKENLRASHYSNGTTIQGRTNPGNTSAYGYLYSGLSVEGKSSDGNEVIFNGNNKVCPMGWHVPSDGEWTELTQYVGNQSTYLCSNNTLFIAKALASSSGWNSSVNTCAVGNTPSINNATGFSALPAGYYTNSGGYGYIGMGTVAYFWSSTKPVNGQHYYRCLNYDDSGVSKNQNYIGSYWYSVRCLRD